MPVAISSHDTAVAVVGMAGRFPGARDVQAFWSNLRDGIESVTFFSDAELRREGVDPVLLDRPDFVRARPILEGFDLFDATAFGIHPREAALMDPQHRLFLECSLEALEHAGHAGDRERTRIGVFAGAGLSAYLLQHLAGNEDAQGAASAAHLGIGNIQDYLATRVAYKLNLRGPAYSVQSACSTSLLAVHLACRSLLTQECDMALAGGVSIALPMRSGYLFQEGGVLSPDGHCRPFDASAAGTIFGSGVGVVVLKPYDQAMSDGDTIYAVVLGSAVNNDGSLKAGFTAPSVAGQAAVITEALASAGAEASSIGYVEAHGTGTALGDPIEVTALTQAYREQTGRVGYCGIGSVKSNVGHLDTAAGVTGFIKTVLALYHGLIPPTLHVREPNPRIDFAASPFYVNATLRPWDPGARRRAGVSAFGVGGTNVHVVLEQAPDPRPSGRSRGRHVLLLSARSAPALEAAAANLADYLDDHRDASLADVAYTLQAGRRTGEHRRFGVCADVEHAIDVLDGVEGQAVFSAVGKPSARSIVFLFPGQGAQHLEMCDELYRDEEVFRLAVDRACAVFSPALGVDLHRVLFPAAHERAAAAGRLKTTDCGEAALCVVEFALAELWRWWGVEPQAVIGHSVGELVAGTTAGVFALEDMAAILAARRRLLGALPAGAMLAVPRRADEIQRLIDSGGSDLSIALINAPASCVVAGEAREVAAFESRLAAKGIPSSRLDTDQAVHSSIVDPALAELEAVLRQVRLAPPRVPLVSNLTGRWMTAREATDPRYWVRQLRQTVYFADGVAELLKDPSRVFVEVGPGITLSTLTRQNAPRGVNPVIVSSLPDHRERRSGADHLLTSVGRLWLAGVEVDWLRFHAGQDRRRVPLPTYPFERQRYWIDPPSRSARAEAVASSDRRPLDEWLFVPGWKQVPLPKGIAAPGSPPGADRIPPVWLVIAEDVEIGDSLAGAILAAGGRVLRVRPGETFDARTIDDLTIRTGVRGDYTRMWQSLRDAGALPDTVLHVPGLATAGPAAQDPAPFFEVLFLAQALTDLGIDKRIGLALISFGLAALGAHEPVCVDHALAAGALRVLNLELPFLACRAIDGTVTDLAAFSQAVVREMSASSPDFDVAWRGRHRWVRSYEPIAAPVEGLESTWRKGDVYLLTGAFGGVGLALAEWLATAVECRLVLIDRSTGPLPPALAGRDADILTIAADVTSPALMGAAVREAVGRFGRIDGAIHAAGVAGAGIAALKSREAAMRVLAPKVDGVRTLVEALDGQPLRFLALCSSLTALAGAVGQIDYCAANAYLDAFAEANAGRAGPHVVSINFDLWRDLGMAAQASVPDARLEERREQLRLAMAPDEGVEAFRRALALGLPRVAVSTLPLGDRLAGRIAAPSGTASPGSHHPRPPLQTPFIEARTDRERLFAALWQQLLGIDRVGVADNFFDLGGDSLTALRFISQLKTGHGLAVRVTDFYAAPTIGLLLDGLGADALSLS